MWYNKEIYKTIKSTIKTDTGQIINGYKRDVFFLGDIQPIDERSYKYTWGSEIKSNIQLFADEVLKVEEIVIYNSIPYKIEKRIQWDDYNIYALLESDVKVL